MKILSRYVTFTSILFVFMTTHRRIVRTNSSEPELLVPVPGIGRSLWIFFLKICRIV